MSGVIDAYARQLWVESGLQERVNEGVRFAVVAVVLLVLLVCIIAIGLIALGVALFMLLQTTMSPAAAAGVTAASFLAVAAIAIGVMWSTMRRQDTPPPPAAAEADLANTADSIHALLAAGASRTAGTIRRQPLASVFTAVLLGMAVDHLGERRD